jgi:hypothetical protein
MHLPEVPAAFDSWLATLEFPLPLTVQQERGIEAQLSELLKATPAFLGTPIEAMLWLRIGVIQRPHEIVQDAHDFLSSYIHAIVHRTEGDFWNSKYWLRRVGQPAITGKIAQQCSANLDAASLQSWRQTGVLANSSYQPDRLVDAVQRWLESTSSSGYSKPIPDPSPIAHLEWQVIWRSLRLESSH